MYCVLLVFVVVVGCCLVFVDGLVVVRCLLCAVWCLLVVVCCMLFAVCHPSFVV